MIVILLWLPVCLGLVVLFLVRKVAIDALSSVATRERDTLLKVQTALRALGGDSKKVKFVPNKARFSALGEGVSRRKGDKATARLLEENRKKRERLKEVRRSLKATLTFRKTKG